MVKGGIWWRNWKDLENKSEKFSPFLEKWAWNTAAAV